MLTHIMTIIAYAATTVRRDADTGAKAQADRTAILDRLLHHSHVLNIKLAFDSDEAQRALSLSGVA